MMKILLLTHYYAPESGAPQRRWTALISRLTSAGHSVDVICPPPHYPGGRLTSTDRALRRGGTEVDAAGARVFRVSFVPHDGRIHTRTIDHLWVAAASVRAARRLARSGLLSPDVVISTSPALETLIAGRIIARRSAVPLVAEMRDAWPDLVAHTPGMATSTSPSSYAKHWVHELVTRLQRDADAVVTTTSTFASVLRARGIRDVTVLRNATELARYDQVDPTVRRTSSSLRVLYMGTIGRSQGLDHVVKAVARLHAMGVAIEARVVGQGADVGRLRRLNQRLGSPVILLGPIEGSKVVEQYAWADSTIVSLRDWEPFAWTVPSKLYELLAAGKHITAIVQGETAEIVREANGGDVVAPGDLEALVLLWSSLAKDRDRLKIGASGRRWVEENADFGRIADEYLKVLARVTAPSA